MSSYVKALEGVMRLFPKKIKVSFIDGKTGVRIAEIKMTLDQLPEKFNKPTLINAMGKQWRVLEASPRKAIEFEFSKKLSLTVNDFDLHISKHGRYYIPTISNEIPEVVESSLFDQFVLEMVPEHWRNIELLPVSMMDQVKEDVTVINSILHPEKKYDRLQGYERRHLREKISLYNHSISFDEFCGLVGVIEKGGVRVSNGGFVKDGFALRSMNYEYYGVMEDRVIKSLCVKEFDCADEELLNVLSAFDLVMAIWGEGRIFSGEMKDVSEDDVNISNADQAADAIIS